MCFAMLIDLEFPDFQWDSVVTMRNCFGLSGLFGLFRLFGLDRSDRLDGLLGLLGFIGFVGLFGFVELTIPFNVRSREPGQDRFRNDLLRVWS